MYYSFSIIASLKRTFLLQKNYFCFAGLWLRAIFSAYFIFLKLNPSNTASKNFFHKLIKKYILGNIFFSSINLKILHITCIITESNHRVC